MASSLRGERTPSSAPDILARLGLSMTEGWFGDDYLISFSQEEVASASDRYSISRFIPGYQVIVFRGWDDLIVRDSVGLVYTVPSVPMDSVLLSQYVLPAAESSLVPDDAISGENTAVCAADRARRQTKFRGQCYLDKPRTTRGVRQVVERPLPLSRRAALLLPPSSSVGFGAHSPYGTQIFLTCVACCRNQRPSPCFTSNQSIERPSLVNTCFRFPIE